MSSVLSISHPFATNGCPKKKGNVTVKQKLAKTLGLGGILVGVAMVSSLAYGGVNEDLKRMQSQLTVSPKLSLNEKLRRLRSHCQKPVDSEPVVVRSDFPGTSVQRNC